ncbi:MAG: nitroreductase family protein [Anaerolineae bacterium]|nr:nitroreductase family protein [Anaerolineae bacterium]
MAFSVPLAELVQRRYSCRTFSGSPLGEDLTRRLVAFLGAAATGPFGARARFELVAATREDPAILRGLGTYGFLKGVPAYIAGAVQEGERDLEDIGYLMEQAVLYATDLGLGTCWLAGTFTRSRFAERIALREDETMPAVIAVGYAAQRPRVVDGLIRVGVRADRRIPWGRLFYDGGFQTPLAPQEAGPYAVPLAMVRAAPSASNRQPWRVVRADGAWHFYLRGSPHYQAAASAVKGASGVQRVDIGIAMCHFALSAAEQRLAGKWAIAAPPIETPDAATTYVASWVEDK